MGEIADDCYDRALDELDRFGEYEEQYFIPRRRAPSRPVATPEDFDNLDEE